MSNSALGLSTASAGTPMRGSLFDRPSTDVLSPAAFTPRSSVKKLVIDKRITGANLSASLNQSTRSQIDRSLINPDADGELGQGNVSLFGANESVSGTPSRSVSAKVASKPAHAPKSLNTLARNVDLDDFEQGEYYTIPDMHSLCNAAHEDLQNVEDFVVGRKGFGELRYLEPVDVASVGDLKSICGGVVVFDRASCEVYPDVDKTPEPGKGLNHRARITLERCFPKDKSTGEPVTDPTAPRVQQHLRKLKAMEGTHYQSYEPATGTWVFEVDHFTRYGLDDDDDDEQDLQDADEQSNIDNGRASRSPVRRDRSMETETTRSPSVVEASAASVASHHSDDSVDERYETAKVQLGAIFEQDTPKASQFIGLPYFHKAEEDDVREFDMTNVEPTSFGEYQLPSSFQPTWSYHSLPGNASLANKHEYLASDMGASRSRLFGAGWSQRGDLVSFGKISSLAGPNQFQPFSVSYQASAGVRSTSSDERRRMQDMIKLQLDLSDIDRDLVPYIQTRGDLRFKNFTDLFTGDKSHEALLWRLGAALFDPLDVKLVDGSEVDMQAFSRKMALSDWLKNAVAPAVEHADLNATSGPDRIFALLSGHRLEEAVDHALESGDMRLATLLATIGNEETKSAMSAQLDAWSKDKVDVHISEEYRRVYALLAGIVDVVPNGDADTVEVTKGLEWLRAFALSFWYKTPLAEPIEVAVETYEERLEQVPALPKPVIMHVSTYRKKQEDAPADGLFSLMQIFAHQKPVFETLADPAHFGKTASEARIQWHLCNILVHVLGYEHDGDFGGAKDVVGFNRLTVAYASQLESADLWTEAIFVLLHLGDDSA